MNKFYILIISLISASNAIAQEKKSDFDKFKANACLLYTSDAADE